MKHDLAGKNVVVTGGAGFIGSHLVRRLLERGVGRVVVVDSLRYGDPANLGQLSGRVQLVKHTLGFDPAEDLARAVEGANYVFHLAAEKHNQSKDDPLRVYKANIEGTHVLYDECTRAGAEKLLFTSSLYAYGRVSGAPFTETEVPRPRTVYGITKLAGEHLLDYFHAQAGVERCAVRYLFVYGPKQFAGMGYKSVIVKSLERLLDGAPPVVFGDGKQTLDYVFVDDAVDATIAAMEGDTDGEVFNVGSGEGTRVEDLIRLMIEVSGRDVEPERGPADWTAGSYRVGDVEKIAEELGWRATTSLREGLTRTLSWLRENR